MLASLARCVLPLSLLTSLSCASAPTPSTAPPTSPTSPEPMATSVPTPAPTLPEDPAPTAESTTSAPTTEEPAVVGYDEVAALLADSSVSWVGADILMAVARRGPVRLRADGPDLGLADRSAFPVPVRLMVLDDAERPRVIIDDGGVRLLSFVERADAQPVVTTRAPLRPSADFVLGDPPRHGHVILEVGAFVDVLAEGEGVREVRWTGGEHPWSGWVDAQVLGTTAHRDQPASQDDVVYWNARRSTVLRAKPGGKALITIDQHESVVAVTTGVTHGHRLVEYAPPCEDEATYVGFVRARDLSDEAYGMLVGCGRGGAPPERPWGSAQEVPRVLVENGRLLLDPDTRAVVGCVREPTELADLGDEHYAVATIWGPVPVRLSPQGVRGACGPSK